MVAGPMLSQLITQYSHRSFWHPADTPDEVTENSGAGLASVLPVALDQPLQPAALWARACSVKLWS